MSDFQITCVDWLLKSEHPSIRYLVKRDLLGETPSQSDRDGLLAPGSPISKMLAELKENQYWIAPRSIYSPKYVATHWSLLLLCEYAAPPDLPQIRQAVRFALEHAHTRFAKFRQNDPADHQMACFFGNVLRYSIYFGFEDDPIVQEILAFLVQPKQGREWCCAYNLNMPCNWGAIRTLWGLAGLPASHQTEAVQLAVSSAVDITINSAAMLGNIDDAPQIPQHSLWEKTSFPLYYQSDRLFCLRALRDAGALHHKQLLPTLRWLAERMSKDGTWRGNNPYKSRSWGFGMEKEDTDHWVTLQSLLILSDAAQVHAL